VTSGYITTYVVTKAVARAPGQQRPW
jgi:hypothetical protein